MDWWYFLRLLLLKRLVKLYEATPCAAINWNLLDLITLNLRKLVACNSLLFWTMKIYWCRCVVNKKNAIRIKIKEYDKLENEQTSRMKTYKLKVNNGHRKMIALNRKKWRLNEIRNELLTCSSSNTETVSFKTETLWSQLNTDHLKMNTAQMIYNKM